MVRSTRSKKKRKAPSEAAEVAPTELKEYISYLRKRAQTDLSQRGGGGRGRKRSTVSEVEVDLDHLVRTVRAIVSTNKEIWEGCKGSKCSESDGALCFGRVGYSKVMVKTESSSSLNFEAVAETTTKDFGYFILLPDKLTYIITPNMGEDGIFPDYERYLDTCLLLHEDILGPFLASLKEHLEAMQVFLGSINS